MIKQYLLSALAAPIGAVLVYALLLVILPLSLSKESAGFLLIVGAIAYAVELVVALPAIAAIRLRVPLSVPASSLLGGVLITQEVGIPAVSFGPWNPTSLPLQEALSAGLVFSMAALVKCAVFANANDSRSRDEATVSGLTRRRASILLVVGLIVWGTAALVWRELTVYWLPPPRVEAFLLENTPLGSSEAEVIHWLASRGRVATVNEARITPNSEYPLTRVGGDAFIHETIAEYRLVFWSSIEAFYIFDGRGRLVDVRVRRSIDSL